MVAPGPGAGTQVNRWRWLRGACGLGGSPAHAWGARRRSPSLSAGRRDARRTVGGSGRRRRDQPQQSLAGREQQGFGPRVQRGRGAAHGGNVCSHRLEFALRPKASSSGDWPWPHASVPLSLHTARLNNGVLLWGKEGRAAPRRGAHCWEGLGWPERRPSRASATKAIAPPSLSVCLTHEKMPLAIPFQTTKPRH